MAKNTIKLGQNKIKIYIFTIGNGIYKGGFYKNLVKLSKDKVHVIDLSFVYNIKKKFKKIHNNKIKYLQPRTFEEIENLLKKRKLVVFVFFPINFKFIKIFYLFKKYNTTNCLLNGSGYLADNKIFVTNLKNNFLKILNNRINHYLLRLFFILNLINKVDFYFEASSTIIKKINSSLSHKIDNLLNKTILSNYKKIYKISSYEFKKKKVINNRILISYIETPLDHGDITLRDGIIPLKNKLEFYNCLNNFFLKILKEYNKKNLYFCKHPSSNIDNFKHVFSKKIKFTENTKKNVLNSMIVIFHQSSAISQAILHKKKIIHLKSKLMGNFLSYRNKLYLKYIKFYSMDVKDYEKFDKVKFEKYQNKISKQFDNFINLNLIDKDKILWYDKIIKILNKYEK